MDNEEMEKRIIELSKIPGVGARFSRRLYDAGYRSAEDLKYATLEDLLKIPGMTEERARIILSGVGEELKEEIEDEEIDKTIREMKKEIAEIEESVERGEEIKFKVVKARAELAPVLLSEEEEAKKEEKPAETQESQHPPTTTPVPSPVSVHEAPPVSQRKETVKSEKAIPKRKKPPVILKESGKPKRRYMPMVATTVFLFLIFSAISVFYLFPKSSDPIQVDGNFSDWENKVVYKSTTVSQLKEIQIQKASVLTENNKLYFYMCVDPSGYLFMGRMDGVDILVILIDADCNASTGYLVSGGGADYKIELIGWENEVVRAVFMRYISTTNGHDWNAWEHCGSVVFRVNKNGIEGKVSFPTSAIVQNPRCFFYMKHTDAAGEYVNVMDTYVYPQQQLLNVNVKLSSDRILQKNNSKPVLNLKFTAKGGYVSLRNIVLLGIPGETAMRFVYSGNEVFLPWILSENNPLEIQVFLKPADVLSDGSEITINALRIDADVPVMFNSFEGKFYIGNAPPQIRIDGCFHDWENITPVLDMDVEEFPSSIDITSVRMVKALQAFCIEVSANIFAGTEVPIGKLVRNQETNASPGQSQNVFGNDYLRVYIDTAPSLNSLNTSKGIKFGYVIELKGISGMLTEKRVYKIEHGNKSEYHVEVDAAINESAVEFKTVQMLPGINNDAVYYFEGTTWNGVVDVVAPVQPLTRYYHEETQGSFSQNFLVVGELSYALYEITAGDLNNDGRTDIVTVGESGVTVWVNNGTVFEKKEIYTSSVVFSCALGDFDRNGWVDILVGTANDSNSDKQEIVIFNNTNLSFTQMSDTTFNLDQDVNSIAVADFNLDGYLDFACGISKNANSEVLYYQNAGTSGFQFANQGIAHPEKNVWAVASARINDDALPEIAYGMGSNNSDEMVILSNKTGSWNRMAFTGDGSRVNKIVPADVNNDGITDVVYGTENGNIGVVWFNFSFGFQQKNYSVGNPVRSLCLSDFDNDGYVDIVSGCDNGSLYLFENMRNGSFSENYLLNYGNKIWDVCVLDYDLDGDGDVAICGESGSIRILNNTLLHRNFEIQGNSCVQLSDAREISDFVLVDLDLDGDLDVVAAHTNQTNFTAQIYAWQNPGNPSYSPFETVWQKFTILSGFVLIYSIAVGDVDNDGYPEIVFAGHNGSKKLLCVCKSDKSPWHNNWTMDYEEKYDNSTPVGVISQIALADMNRDGILDVITGDRNGYLVVFKRGTDPIDNNGDWLDSTAKIQNNTTNTVGVADFNCDGWMDIACGYEANSQAGVIWANLRDPFNSSGWAQYLFESGVNNTTRLTIADLNNDGKPDIAGIVNGTHGTLWLNPGGNLSHQWHAHTFEGFIGVKSIAAGDMDNNGWADLLLGLENGTIAVLRNTQYNFSPTYLYLHYEPVVILKAENIDRKSSYDGNDLDLCVGVGNDCFIYKNTGANTKIVGFPLGASSILANETKALLKLNITHNGISTDNPVRFSALSVQFLNSTAHRIMAPDEMRELFENVSIWLDGNNNSVFDQNGDIWLGSLSNQNFNSSYGGYIRVCLAENSYSTISPMETKTYFITVRTNPVINASYNGYIFNISILPESNYNYTWNYIYNSISGGIATIVESYQYYSSNYTFYVEENSINIFIIFLPLLVCVNAVHYRKLRRKTF
ncbi:MAG: FG-GAP-like repeat-containing protein [Thermoplasmata archaeon]